MDATVTCNVDYGSALCGPAFTNSRTCQVLTTCKSNLYAPSATVFSEATLALALRSIRKRRRQTHNERR